MSALGIAFDITIVGALALSWMALTVDLFFVSKEQRVLGLLKSASKEAGPVLGVMLFAVAYFLGTAVSRVGQDFLNDDDLWRALNEDRWPTESNIRAYAYCDAEDQRFEAIVKQSIKDIPVTAEDSQTLCAEYKRAPARHALKNKNSVSKINDVFRLQESALLLGGEDKTARFRQLREQIIVLRGAAFNGFLAFWLSLFGVCAQAKVHLRASTSSSTSTLGRRLLTGVERFWPVPPFVVLAAAALAFYVHWRDRHFQEPPFMEFTLVVLASVGFLTVLKGTKKNYGAAALFSALLTPLAWLSWWLTEMLYDEQVIYSFYALHNLAK